MTRMHRLILPILMLFIFIGCDSKRQKHNNEIQRVVFASGGCFGTCPSEALSIDSSLAVMYEGIKYTDKIGHYTGHVTREFWDSLNIKLEASDYKNFDKPYFNSVDDQPIEIYIYYNDTVKHIHGQSISLPGNIMTVHNWLFQSISKLDLIPTQDSLAFPTLFEIPAPTPVPDNLKFTP